MAGNPAARSLAAQLPVTVTFSGFGGKEKIAYFPEGFTLRGAPRGHGPSAGDFCVYAPWGNLAIFYKGSSPSGSLVPLGAIESGLEALAAQTADFEALVEVLE